MLTLVQREVWKSGNTQHTMFYVGMCITKKRDGADAAASKLSGDVGFRGLLGLRYLALKGGGLK